MSSHTFTMDASVLTHSLLNTAGQATEDYMSESRVRGRAIRVGGTNHSHATQDLYDLIAACNYPKWKLFIQTMDPNHVDKLDFDPLDVTKVSKDIFPLQPVGRLVLNRNIDNFFAENEMLAFSPAFRCSWCVLFSRLITSHQVLILSAGLMLSPMLESMNQAKFMAVTEKGNNFKQSGDLYLYFAHSTTYTLIYFSRQEQFLRRIVRGLSALIILSTMSAAYVSHTGLRLISPLVRR